MVNWAQGEQEWRRQPDSEFSSFDKALAVLATVIFIAAVIL